MYKQHLQKHLQNGFFKHGGQNFFALYGGDNFQSELFSDLIKEQFEPDECKRVYFEEYDFKEASDYLGSNSLFSERKMLEIKSNKKLSKKDMSVLVDLCKKNKDSFLLFILYDESSKQSELEKGFEEYFARFFKPSNLREANELLALKAKSLNINATYNALNLLYASFDENLYLAGAELNKFAGLSIDEKVVEKYCFSLSLTSFESFFDELLKGKIIDLEKLIENMNEIALLNALQSNFYRLFKIFLFAKTRGNVDFKELFGYAPPPLVAKKMQEQAFLLNVEQYRQIFTLFLQSEYELKTNSKLAKKEFLIASLLQFAKIVKN